MDRPWIAWGKRQGSERGILAGVWIRQLGPALYLIPELHTFQSQQLDSLDSLYLIHAPAPTCSSWKLVTIQLGQALSSNFCARIEIGICGNQDWKHTDCSLDPTAWKLIAASIPTWKEPAMLCMERALIQGSQNYGSWMARMLIHTMDRTLIHLGETSPEPYLK